MFGWLFRPVPQRIDIASRILEVLERGSLTRKQLVAMTGAGAVGRSIRQHHPRTRDFEKDVWTVAKQMRRRGELRFYLSRGPAGMERHIESCVDDTW